MHGLSRYVTHADRGDFAALIEAGSGEAKSPVDIKRVRTVVGVRGQIGHHSDLARKKGQENLFM